jgi:ATP-dependent Clp protease ATP-binding subunit ClpC
VFERFTESARQVVVRAQEEARELHHGYIGTEHLLLGLLGEPDRIPAKVLAAHGLDAEFVREQVRVIVGAGEAPSAGQIPFTPRAKKVLEMSLREALSLGNNHIGTEHLFLGLLREDESVAVQILGEGTGVSTDQLRDQVLALAPGPDRDVPASTVRQPPQPSVAYSVMPDAPARRLLMRAAARALEDGRTEFSVQDVRGALDLL